MPRAMATRCLHAARQHVRIDVGEAAQPDLVDIVERLFLGFPGGEPGAGAQREDDILLDGLPRQQLVELLEHHHPVRARPHDLAAVEGDAPLGRFDIAADRLQQGRLAAAGRPEHDIAVGAKRREIDAIGRGDEGVRGFVLQGDAVDLQERRRGFRVRAAAILPRLRGQSANLNLLDIAFTAC